MRKNDFEHLWLMFFCFLFFTTKSAYADAGTLLMWLGAGHLLFGNAVIGLCEGFIVAKIFQVRMSRGILIMVLANYVSMIAGAAGIWALGSWFTTSISINNMFKVIMAMLAGSYLATLLIEWPFCFWILKGKDSRGGLSFKASAIINTASYAILIPLYLSASGTSLITNIKVDHTLSFLKTDNAQIYFLSPPKEALYKINANGSAQRKIKNVGFANDDAQLFICNKDGKAHLNVRWYERENNRYQDYSKILIEELPGLTAVNEACDGEKRWYGREVIDFRPPDMRDWDVSTGTWAIAGLRGENKKTGKSLWIALETPFLMWPISNATILPEDQVICQVGNQIVLVDLTTRRIGLITFGTSPVVVLE